MEWTQIFLIIGVAIFFLYKLLTMNENYWKIRGIKYKSPVFPFLGDHAPAVFRRGDAITLNLALYNLFKGSFFGMFNFSKPSLVVKDPELLKQIMVKDADHFINRFNLTRGGDSFLDRNLTFLRDEQWKQLRAVMTTVFTGAKMKDMFGFMETCGNQAVDNMVHKINHQTQYKDGDVLEVDVKDFFSRFGTDVIASTAFGLEVDSFKHPNNEFFEVGTELISRLKSAPVFKLIFIMIFPKIAKLLKITFFGEKINNFFTSIVTETIRNREKYNIVRKDLIHILTEARKGKITNEQGDFTMGKLPNLTDQDIAAQAISFFFGGFDVMAAALSFLCYELAVNPDIQEKLYEDIDEVIKRENRVTYDGVMYHMQYLDMVVKELLRKWPPLLVSDREVSKTYVIPKSEGCPELTLKRGDSIMIPILGLHRDPDYHPEPEKFDPERFRDEKNTIKPYTYMPFGVGIRNCIAMRYAIMEIKIGLICLIRKFYIVPTEKTDIPLKLTKRNGFVARPEKGFWMGLKLRA